MFVALPWKSRFAKYFATFSEVHVHNINNFVTMLPTMILQVYVGQETINTKKLNLNLLFL